MKIQAKNAKWYLQQVKIIAQMETGIENPDSGQLYDAQKTFERLRRIEARAHRQYEHFCNVGYSDEEREAFDAKIEKAVVS